ncbi:Ig-like domain-containing protein [Bacillus sp. CGMCC 1.16607]|uniref:Ig-like domain-containing protein n=1 Tax=Bacillus sp. CGMCC 1.16607 TaxID=3351842 RepID=UPI003633ABAC
MKKLNYSMKIYVTILMTLVSFISLLSYPIQTSAAGTIVSGTITSDTVWTKQGSPYTISGGIIITPNVTLTIEPGVEVIAGSGKVIDVQGKLKAVGTPLERILLRDVYVNGWDWANQSIHLEYTNLFHENFNGGFLVSSLRREVILRHNRFSNGLVHLSYPTNEQIVEYNLFTNGSYLNINNGIGKVVVRNNTFLNEGKNQADISVSSREPEGNYPNVEITQNNFFDVNKLAVNLEGFNQMVFNGLNNYWGTTDLEVIRRKIGEVQNKLNIETIAYKPIQNGMEYGAFAAPKLLPVGDNESRVSGFTDGDSLISIYSGSQLLGNGIADSNGNFSVTIPIQRAGTRLTITVVDSYGRKSMEGTLTVQDTTPPKILKVNDVTNLSTKVTGITEAGANVTVVKDGVVIGSNVALVDGTFEIAIPQQVLGQELSIYSTDTAGNKSNTITILVTDKMPPTKPVLTTTDVTDQTTIISGTGEHGSTILVKNSGMVLATAIVNQTGTFYVHIPVQKAGSTLEVIASDREGNVSQPEWLTVRDVTPPAIKHISPITNQSVNINGLAESGSTISIKVNQVEIASTVTKSDGTFIVVINPLEEGTVLEVTARDVTGNISPTQSLTVQKLATLSFNDLLSTHRFFNEINFLLAKEVITGFPDGTFRPSQQVTRAQAAIMIGRALGLNGTQRETGLKDVDSSSKASGYIASAVERGIITGFPDQTYRPDAPVTRGQMAIFISRAFNLQLQAEVSFPDVPEASKTSVHIKRILADRITTGYPDGTFKPERVVIRSDFSAFMARAMDERFK